MARKLSKEAYTYIINKIKENGSMSTDEVIELVRPHYDYDPGAARERELRRYVGQLMRVQRDQNGVRTMFLEKGNSEIIDLERCTDSTKIAAVEVQLKAQVIGSYRSYRKATRRRMELTGQLSIFDESALFKGIHSA